MYQVTWFNMAGEPVGRVNAGNREQAEQKIRATISREQFQADAAFELVCTEAEREQLTAFIQNEMANSAAMVPSTLEP